MRSRFWCDKRRDETAVTFLILRINIAARTALEGGRLQAANCSHKFSSVNVCKLFVSALYDCATTVVQNGNNETAVMRKLNKNWGLIKLAQRNLGVKSNVLCNVALIVICCNYQRSTLNRFASGANSREPIKQINSKVQTECGNINTYSWAMYAKSTRQLTSQHQTLSTSHKLP